MPPEPVTSPTRRFVLTRVDGAVETNVAVGALLPANFTTDQAARNIAMSNARSLREQNPGVVYLLYSPSNGGDHTDNDLIWRSDVSD